MKQNMVKIHVELCKIMRLKRFYIKWSIFVWLVSHTRLLHTSIVSEDFWFTCGGKRVKRLNLTMRVMNFNIVACPKCLSLIPEQFKGNHGQLMQLVHFGYLPHWLFSLQCDIFSMKHLGMIPETKSTMWGNSAHMTDWRTLSQVAV